MKVWKESASLILAARHAQSCNYSPTTNYNYNLLCLKRHKNSKFMPSTYVFPGGVVHPSDGDLKWHKLFSTYGIDANKFEILFPNTSMRPLIFTHEPNVLAKEISLRITAIRETFEECGILICKSSKDDTSNVGWSQCIKIPEVELENWQTRVHNDAREFYTLCENFKCYPDLWSLYEWSNWLTPTYFTGRRYNTIFYLSCLPVKPNTICELTEIEDSKWDTPRNFMFTSTNVSLPPPQQFEVTRITKYEDIDNLLSFAINRNKTGVLLNLPVKIKLQDGKVHVLPGDAMYPKQVNLYEEQVIHMTDITIREFRDMSSIKNRIEFSDFQVPKVYVHNVDSASEKMSLFLQ